MADEKTTLTLFVEKEKGKLLFAEATKEFFDFLFYILVLPVAAVFHDNESLCISNLYRSVANKDSALINSYPQTYLFPQTYLLRPNGRVDLPRLMQKVSLPCKLDDCKYHGGTVYMVRDDLTVTPMKADSLISIMSELNIKTVKAIEAKTVDVGLAECTKLVTTLRSKTVLTDVFLAMNSPK